MQCMGMHETSKYHSYNLSALSMVLWANPKWGTTLVQIGLFNEAQRTKKISFYIKQRQEKTECGVSGREGEREREKRIKRVRDAA